jgi:tryptophan 2,3-dioxygenase
MWFPKFILRMAAQAPKAVAEPHRSSTHPTYWDYIRLDELLALARPKTALRDERVFIIFHQLAEMILALIINELEQLTARAPAPIDEWKMRLTRIVTICGLFIHNINALGRSIDREQFLHFREALSPASGFQSFQYRKMELMSTRLGNLAKSELGGPLPDGVPLDLLFERLYWRQAIPGNRSAGERASLLDFEARYLQELRKIAVELEHRNLAAAFDSLPHEHRTDKSLMSLMREFDRMVNQEWREAHYRLALLLLDGSGAPRSSTGGTDWKTYLRKSLQISFFPDISGQSD